MISHQHEVQICAGCAFGELSLAVSLLRDHNNTLAGTQGTLKAEAIVTEIVEAIRDATTFVSTYGSPPEAGLGQGEWRPRGGDRGSSGFGCPDSS